MKAWIISNGSINDYDFYKEKIQSTDFVICADGGAKHAEKIGVLPNVIVGDFDSIGEKYFNDLELKNIELIRYSTDKNETDTQLAVEYALQRGCSEVILIGSLGSRFDHSLANVSLLKLLLDKGIQAKILNENNEIYLIDNHIRLKGELGEKVSLLPITEMVSGITTQGLQYALKDAQMVFGVPNGISNIFIKEEADINVKEGLLLVVKAWD
ncbi:MAG: thiamine diphosphokinase [Clostridia bacterium]